MRKHYLDNIRWATVVTVVIYHVFYMYNAEGILGGLGKITDLDVQYYDVFQYAVYPWIMPILFIVAGVCSRLYLENHTDREFVKSRTNKLLVPSTIGLLVFQFLQGYLNTELSGVFEKSPDMPKIASALIILASGCGVLWFIQLLWLFSMLLLLIRKIEKDRLYTLGGKANLFVLLLLVVPVWTAGLVLNTPIVSVYRFGFYGLQFLLGYFVFSHETVIEILKKYAAWLIAAALCLCIAFCVRYFGANYADAPVNRTTLYAAFAWISCLAILGGAAKYFDCETPFTARMTKRSFGLYVFHYLGISAVAVYIARPALLPAPAVYALSLIAGFASGYGLNAVVSRIPFFRWAVLGICKAEKHN